MLSFWILLCLSVSLICATPLTSMTNALITDHSLKPITSITPEPESSAVSGYYVVSYFDDTACSADAMSYSRSYKANSCIPKSSESNVGLSFMFVLSSSTSCANGTVVVYSDRLCQNYFYTTAMTYGCDSDTSVSSSGSCQADFATPVDTWLVDLYLNTSVMPECDSTPDVVQAYALNNCQVSGSGSVKFQCSPYYLTTEYFSDEVCQFPTSSDNTTLYQCGAVSLYYGFYSVQQYGCYFPTSASSPTSSNDDDGSNSKPKALGISRVLWVFIGVAGIVFIFACVMIIRWLRRRNRPPTPPGEVKMVTLFPKDATVRYAAPSEMRI